jgi:splicing factor 45
MSQAIKNESGEDAYQRRLALSAAGQQQPPLSVVHTAPQPTAFVSSSPEDDDNDETDFTPGLGSSNFVRSDPDHPTDTSFGEATRPAEFTLPSAGTLPIPPPAAVRIPTPPGMGYNPFAPPSVPPPPPSMPNLEDQIAAKRKAAAAIAAKFSALGGGPASSSAAPQPPVEPQPSNASGGAFNQ